ncbi:MAG: DEAD/DEAH box helicase, partial [Gemmatimonadaceae bacterium]|nr:DEAD/DEAH box helicase [Gemmatimonadaceae bacterium]
VASTREIGSLIFFMTPKTQTAVRFSDLGLSGKMLSILERQNFTVPTPIQHKCIPLALEGRDIVGIAQTGTGKTLAFGLPMIERLAKYRGQALILMPTRELALQVDEVLQQIGRPIGLKTAVVIGGASSHQQLQMLRRNPHVVVSTPGRLIDHLKQKNYSLRNVKIIILDEADRMLDIGFAPQLKQILSVAPTDRQTMLFSATMPGAIAQIAAGHMKMPLRIEVAPSGTPAENIDQKIFVVGKEQKMQLLDKMLTDNSGTALIFARTKFGAKKITANLNAMRYNAAEIHSNRSLAQRKAALGGFKSGEYRVLVATDIAARGIDVSDIAMVINFDLPDNPEDYVHRIGRTGRAGNSGQAISFATPEEKFDVRQIERLIRREIPVIGLPVLPLRRANVQETDRGYGRGNGSYARGGSRNFQKRSGGFKRGSAPKQRHGGREFGQFSRRESYARF